MGIGAETRRLRWVRGLAVGLLAAACASMETSGPDQLHGASGPVVWEIVGVRSTLAADGREIRWAYTLILRNTSNERIQFEALDTQASSRPGARAELLAGRRVDPFKSTLEGKSELRLNLSYGVAYTIGSAARPAEPPMGREGIDVLYRLRGADASSRPVAVTIRIHLDPSVGRIADRPRVESSAPDMPNAPEEPSPGPSSGPPEGDIAVLWEAARQCEGRFPGAQTLRVDRDGAIQAHVPSVADQEPFSACFRTTAEERLAGRVSWPSESPGTTVVALELVEGNILLVPVTINARHETRLVLDTGASKTILSPALLARLELAVPTDSLQVRLSGITGGPVTVSLTRVARLTVGQVTVEDLFVGVHDVPTLPRGAEGLLGADVLRHFRVSVDRGALRLKLEAAP